MENYSDVSKHVIDITDTRNIVSVELVQHQRVKLLLETSNVGEAITAELWSSGCRDELPCPRMDHSFFHSDSQSYLTLTVHPPEKDGFYIYVTGVLVFVLSCLLLTWMIRKWMRWRHKGGEEDKVAEEKETKFSQLNSIETAKCEEIHRSHHATSLSTKRIPDASTTMTQSTCSQASRCSLWILFLALLAAVCLLVMVVKFGATTFEHSSDVPVLRLKFPEKKLIRHIRSYSEDPSIRDVSFSGEEGQTSLVTRLQLLDLSPDCRSNLTGCRTHALCDTHTSDGQMKCRCQRGFYLQDFQCLPCQTTCKEGHYMTQQCSANTDVKCKPCSQCEGSSYEVAACTSTQDTICIDVTFPLKQFQSKGITMTDLVEWNVTVSKNVFLERLQGIKNVGTAFYVTSNRQAWMSELPRPSGLMIRVKVSEVYLVPEYVDVDHIDDTDYISLARDYLPNDKNRLRFVQNNYCRSPIPDEYDMTLEIANGAVTESVEVPCDSTSALARSCPPGYSDGSKIILHKLNSSCLKERTAKGYDFRYSSNNILCLGNNELLQQVFNMKVGNPVDLTFPSDDCVQNQQECGRCLSRESCDRVSNETDCCNLKCHERPACKQYFSDRCPPAPVECTRGDVTKFSISPHHSSISKQFSCHLRHLPPQYLYELSYNVTIPGLDVSLGTRARNIPYKGFMDLRRGSNQADFLLMTHVTESQYDDEVILIGEFNSSYNNDVKSYSFHKLKSYENFDRLPGFNIIHSGGDKFRTNIQFEKPFLYSTKTWWYDSCQKNVSRIFPSQPINEKDGIKLKLRKKEQNDRFIYMIQSEGTDHRLRFSIPANTSVLSYYRDTYSSVRVNPWDLKGQMTWNTATLHWNVTLSGTLTACPGIFTLEIYTENMDIFLARYDMVVDCPKEFSTSFEIARNSVEFVDIFILVLNDSVTSYRIVLSSLQGPQYFSTIAETDDKKTWVDQSPWTPIIVILIICLCVSVCLSMIYVYCDRQKSKLIPSNISVPKPDLGPQITLLQNIDKHDVNKGLSWKSKCIMTTLIALYTAYAVIFTFLAIFGLFHLIQGPSLARVTLATNTSTQVRYQMQRALDEIIEYENNEIDRMLSHTEQRVKACSTHLKSSVFENVPDGKAKLQRVLTGLFRKNGIMGTSADKYLSAKQAAYQRDIDEFLAEFNHTLDAKLHKIQVNYSSYLNSLVESTWLTFPKEVFMQQELMKGRVMKKVSDNLTGFLRWLEIDKVQEIFDMREILMSRVQKMMPEVDFSSLLNASDGVKEASVDLDFNISANAFKFSSNNPKYTPLRSYDSTHLLFDVEHEPSSRKRNSFYMSDIKGIIYPVFICTFLVLDSFLLFYRFSWMIKCIKVFKTGLEDKVPYDTMTKKIHFILTGRNVPKPEDSFDDPYDFVRNKKENIWGENTEQYFIYCNSPEKTKIEILRQLWQDKQQLNPKPEPTEKKENCCKVWAIKFVTSVYRLFISPVFWRLTIICGFVLILCFIAKATNDLVTLESAMFLLDTDVMLPILERQNAITNNVITHYESYLNKFLDGYKGNVDGEVQMINSILLNVAERQEVLLNTMISDMCNLIGQSSCVGGVDLVANSLTSCNFLPVHSKPLKGFHESLLLDYIKQELTPLVTSLRNLLFNSLYLFLLCAAVMLLCQITARVIFVHLKNSRHIKVTTIYQLPSRCEFPDQQDLQKDIYASQSVIAESCESGVYDMTS